ncbi:MAG: hypothetical protein QM610_14940 [Chitinophagaceae bacterium]
MKIVSATAVYLFIVVPTAVRAQDSSAHTKHLSNDTSHTLDPVTVQQRSYHNDSLANRKEYGKYFKYKKPEIHMEFGGVPDSLEYKPRNVVPLTTAKLDVDAMLDVFNKGKKKRMQSMQKNLVYNEQQGYIDNRFKKATIVRYIGVQPDTLLQNFMLSCRPSYEFLAGLSEIDLAMYIKNAFKTYCRQHPTDATKTGQQ